ncbi:hypothetical protein CDAR_269461 [Caerostris darwini]|uniref:Uncharacterized protein n=1 Tax=Caerostris darwini TaxID=1538125 RepID=A0AAV4VRZ6_9ARAC|nr:hypothetical protein CDAR_269461 [Caerostris darwini]
MRGGLKIKIPARNKQNPYSNLPYPLQPCSHPIGFQIRLIVPTRHHGFLSLPKYPAKIFVFFFGLPSPQRNIKSLPAFINVPSGWRVAPFFVSDPIKLEKGRSSP